MPIIKSAIKATRQTEKRTAHNQFIKKSIKQALKAFKTNPTFANFQAAQSEYDKAVKKNLLHKNTASRRKSALANLAKASGMKLETTKITKTPTKSQTPTPKTKSAPKTK